METLPILRSTLSPQALVPLIEVNYGLVISRLQLIKAAILDTYRVVAENGRYILRIYPHRRRTLAVIKAELEFLQFLYERELPVSVPVLSISGELLLTLPAPEGERYAALFTCAPGKPLHNDLDAVLRYGRVLARIHAAADSFPQSGARAPLDLALLLDRPLRQLEAIGNRSDDWSYLRRLADIIRRQAAELPRTSPYFGYCHGDACKGNVHVSADGQLTFFDFDFCGPGWRVYDLATFVSGESAQAAAAFLAGYQTVRSLADLEHRAIPLFQIAQSIWMLGTRASYINEWGEIRLSGKFIEQVLGQIQLNVARYGIFVK